MGTQSRIRVRPDKQKRDRTGDESKIATVVAATPTPGEDMGLLANLVH